MLGLSIAVIILNSVAFISNKRLTENQILHIWLSTIVFQLLVDMYLSLKYHGYWYFNKGVEWSDLPALTLLGAPTIMLFLNWFPFHTSFLKRMFYIILWSILIVIYEVLSLLPEPWGYFHYGWWKLEYSALSYPFLLLITLYYHKSVSKVRKTN
ncbi:MAG TPA: hypothetical protein VNS08_17170 [Ureibacillus sp.]|nr:hypothetical protein [Ureibacillus sp.]